MILAVTPNPAVDVTYRLPRLKWRGTNRVASVEQRAGGKGVNVARVAADLGSSVLTMAPLGGDSGDQVAAGLGAADIPCRAIPIGGSTRRTVTVVEDDSVDATVFNEPGPHVEPDEWELLRGRYRKVLAEASVVVLSGSLPPGVPDTAYARLVADANEAGVPSVLDAAGAALRHGVMAGPAVVKPNEDELVQATGVTDVTEGMRAIRDWGAESVVVSLGSRGVLAATPRGAYRVPPPAPVSGNPTGCGDALVATLAVHIAAGSDWHEQLTDAVAVSAAAVLVPYAGAFDREAYARFRPLVQVGRITERSNRCRSSA